MKKLLVILAVLAVVGLVSGELVARYALGLGDPPLSVPDRTIEYMFAPNQEVHQFGNRQIYNSYGMRSGPVPEDGRKILVFGDSVVNGGNLTDQSELATERLAARLAANREAAYVGNVSAGSWGPGNLAAWVERYGFLGAEEAILVLSSHDLADTPAFEPLSCSTHPTEKPLSALVELIQRYLPRYMPDTIADAVRCKGRVSVVRDPSLTERTGEQALAAFLDRAAKEGVRTCVILHLTQAEIANNPEPAHEKLEGFFTERGIPVIDFLLTLKGNVRSTGDAYRDAIHLNATGQFALTDAMYNCLLR